jgi:hypothetical protein
MHRVFGFDWVPWFERPVRAEQPRHWILSRGPNVDPVKMHRGLRPSHNTHNVVAPLRCASHGTLARRVIHADHGNKPGAVGRFFTPLP